MPIRVHPWLKSAFQCLNNSAGRHSVAIGIVRQSHGCIFLRVTQQLGRFSYNALHIGTHQLDRSGCDGFGAFGGVAHDQDRFAQGRRFFLDTTGISDDQAGAIHQVDERQVIQGFDEMDAFLSGKNAFNRLLDVRIEVHGVEDFHIIMSRCNPLESRADLLKTLTEVLPPMTSDQDQTFRGGPDNQNAQPSVAAGQRQCAPG